MLDRVEASIKARIESQLPTLRVLSSMDMDGARERQIVAPAIFLLYDGAEVSDSSPRDGVVSFIETRWAVVLLWRNAIRAHEGDSARSEALARVPAMHEALAGFQPEGAHSRLKLIAMPEPEFEPPFYYLPMIFSCKTVLRTDGLP